MILRQVYVDAIPYEFGDGVPRIPHKSKVTVFVAMDMNPRISPFAPSTNIDLSEFVPTFIPMEYLRIVYFS